MYIIYKCRCLSSLGLLELLSNWQLYGWQEAPFLPSGYKNTPVSQTRIPLLDLEKLVPGEGDLVFQRSPEGLLDKEDRYSQFLLPAVQNHGDLLRIE